VAYLPDVQARVHGGDADGAGGGVAVAGRGSGGGESRKALWEGNLANSLLQQGKFAEAERMLRKLHDVQMRVYGAEGPQTLTTVNNLGQSLSGQGNYFDAEGIQRELLRVWKRVLGAEHPGTLTSANNLAMYLSKQICGGRGDPARGARRAKARAGS
jgi:hypothetical protein